MSLIMVEIYSYMAYFAPASNSHLKPNLPVLQTHTGMVLVVLSFLRVPAQLQASVEVVQPALTAVPFLAAVSMEATKVSRLLLMVL
jgi:hypothetical protein